MNVITIESQAYQNIIDKLNNIYALINKNKLGKVDALDMTVKEMDLSTRATKALLAANIRWVREIVSFDRFEILRYRNMGKKSVDEIESFLHTHNLSYGMKG